MPGPAGAGSVRPSARAAEASGVVGESDGSAGGPDGAGAGRGGQVPAQQERCILRVAAGGRPFIQEGREIYRIRELHKNSARFAKQTENLPNSAGALFRPQEQVYQGWFRGGRFFAEKHKVGDKHDRS